MLLSGTSAGLEEVPLTTRLDASVSASPTVKLIGPLEVSWLIVLSGIFEIVGASFTGVTVNTNVSLLLRAPSLTVTLMVALPDWFAAGITVTVRLEPLPPKTILPFGTSPGFEDVPLTTRLEAGLSASPTVKLIGPVEVSSAVVWSGMSEITGGELFTGLTVRWNEVLPVSEPSLTLTVTVAVPT